MDSSPCFVYEETIRSSTRDSSAYASGELKGKIKDQIKRTEGSELLERTLGFCVNRGVYGECLDRRVRRHGKTFTHTNSFLVFIVSRLGTGSKFTYLRALIQ